VQHHPILDSLEGQEVTPALFAHDTDGTPRLLMTVSR